MDGGILISLIKAKVDHIDTSSTRIEVILRLHANGRVHQGNHKGCPYDVPATPILDARPRIVVRGRLRGQDEKGRP